jgi:hypothetical protein
VTIKDRVVVQNRRKLSDGKLISGSVLIGRGAGAAQLRRELPVGTRVRMRWDLAGQPQGMELEYMIEEEGLMHTAFDGYQPWHSFAICAQKLHR